MGVSIVIPTLDELKGQNIGRLARITAGCIVPVEVIVSHDKNHQGFTKTANAGMRLAKSGNDICLLNDDILSFQYGWLRILRKKLYASHTYGLSCPSGASAAKPMNAGRPGMIGTQVVPQASFWCVLLKAEMVKQLGLLDEELIHYCSDNLYCSVMRKRKWLCVWVKSVYLKHRKHGSGIQRKWRDHDRKVFFRRLGK